MSFAISHWPRHWIYLQNIKSTKKNFFNLTHFTHYEMLDTLNYFLFGNIQTQNNVKNYKLHGNVDSKLNITENVYINKLNTTFNELNTF